MLILGLDTSSAQGQLCLLENSKILSHLRWTKEGSHSELITDKLSQALRESNKQIKDIQEIYCGIGPGSFTGIRVGVSFAKSLAFSLNLKVIPVNSLMALALSCSEDGSVISLIDAQKNSFFLSRFKKEKKNLEVYEENLTVSIDDLKKYLSEKAHCCGDGFPRYKNLLDSGAKSLLLFKDENQYFDMTQVILWNSENKKIKSLSWAELQAFYIRPSSAEEKLQQKTT